MADIDLAGLLKQFMSEYSSARSENQNLYESGQSDLSKVVEAYQSGGGATSGLLREGMAPVEQNMVSRGLSGTTRPGAVRAGMAADIESQRMAGLAAAGTAKAEYGANFQDIYPSTDILSHLATGGFSGLLSKEIAQAGMVPDYSYEVDYGGPSAPTSTSISGSSSGGGVTGLSDTNSYSNNLFNQLNENSKDSGGNSTGNNYGSGEHFPTNENYTLFRPGKEPLSMAPGETLFPAGGGEPITAINPGNYRTEKGGYSGLMEAYAAAKGQSWM